MEHPRLQAATATKSHAVFPNVRNQACYEPVTDQTGTRTFHSNVDALMSGELRLHQHIARILSFIHILLHIEQLQGAVVLEGPLPVVVRQQVGVLVPLDGVVWVADDAAVDVHVPPSDGSEVFHWSDAGRPLKDTLERQLS